MSRDERTTATIVNGQKSAECGEEKRAGDLPGGCWTNVTSGLLRENRREGRIGDIELNAPNKPNVMELMTGCVPLALVARAYFVPLCVACKGHAVASCVDLAINRCGL